MFLLHLSSRDLSLPQHASRQLLGPPAVRQKARQRHSSRNLPAHSQTHGPCSVRRLPQRPRHDGAGHDVQRERTRRPLQDGFHRHAAGHRRRPADSLPCLRQPICQPVLGYVHVRVPCGLPRNRVHYSQRATFFPGGGFVSFGFWWFSVGLPDRLCRLHFRLGVLARGE